MPIAAAEEAQVADTLNDGPRALKMDDNDPASEEMVE
jgi:hypothetical protein